MSRKINGFASFLTQPLNVYNFEIRIKSISDKVDENVLMVVKSTSIPAEKMRKMTQTYQGETISYMAKPDASGEWTFTLPEGDRAQVKKELDRLKHRCYNQDTGMLTPQPWYNVEVYQKDLQDNIVLGVVLHGAWLVGRNSQNLDTADVTKSYEWTYTFQYQWLKDIDFDAKGTPNPFGE